GLHLRCEPRTLVNGLLCIKLTGFKCAANALGVDAKNQQLVCQRKPAASEMAKLSCGCDCFKPLCLKLQRDN
ncbi:MAG: hypothetical protein ACKVOO_02320, partial [Burkholderiaceae bacterium]